MNFQTGMNRGARYDSGGADEQVVLLINSKMALDEWSHTYSYNPVHSC
jgi:hypothetical protein